MNKSKIYSKPSKDEWYTPTPVFEYAREIMGGGYNTWSCHNL